MDIRSLTRLVRTPAAALSALVCGTALTSAVASEPVRLPGEPAVIEGQLFDRDGRPLAGRTIQLIEVRTPLSLPFVEKKTTQRVVDRAESDAHGMFRFELPLERRKGRLWVRCYDKSSWDHVRYDVPEDIDVTYDAYERGSAIVSCAVDDAPAWTELVREIERAGGTTTRQGGILRTHGLPPEIRNEGDGRVRWVYRNVEYLFEEGRLIETIEKPELSATAGSAS